MEQFTNEKLDTDNLPKFEEVQLTKIAPAYAKIVALNVMITFAIIFAVLVYGSYQIPEWGYYTAEMFIGYLILLVISAAMSWVSYRNKAYAFREHDVMFRYGIISTNTTVIPYNRVQHVSLHEGFVSRKLGLAKIQIFTAGSSTGDIAIPGIKVEQAIKIRELLAGKIQKEL
jgi:membrane protein YdbS with pleckstrin-like domain